MSRIAVFDEDSPRICWSREVRRLGGRYALANMFAMPARRSAKNAKVARADGLNRDAILSAALDLARRTGLDGFSMRDLAAELGTTQMAAYHYVKSRDELLTLLVDEILCFVRYPGPEDGTWDERLRIFVESCLDVLGPWADSGSVL